MKNIPLFEDFAKSYGQKMTIKEFESIEVGSIVLYVGTRYEVKKNNGATLTLKPINGGSETTVNLNMFNQRGAIVEGRVFEAEFNGTRVCIFPGRFQPFHNGHIAALERTSKQFGLPVVPLQILSKSDKSPFPDMLLKKIGNAVAKEFSFIAAYFLYPSDRKTVIPQMVKFLREEGYESIGMGAGSDRMKAYEPQIKYLNSEKSDVPVSEPFILKNVDERQTGGPSGTKVREAIMADDKAAFDSMTPKSVHPFYNELKKHLK